MSRRMSVGCPSPWAGSAGTRVAPGHVHVRWRDGLARARASAATLLMSGARHSSLSPSGVWVPSCPAFPRRGFNHDFCVHVMVSHRPVVSKDSQVTGCTHPQGMKGEGSLAEMPCVPLLPADTAFQARSGFHGHSGRENHPMGCGSWTPSAALCATLHQKRARYLSYMTNLHKRRAEQWLPFRRRRPRGGKLFPPRGVPFRPRHAGRQSAGLA